MPRNPSGVEALMLPESLALDRDPCDFSERWGIHPSLGGLLILLARIAVQDPRLKQLLRTVDSIKMISGFRSRESQEALDRAGRPTAPFDRSTHTSCPATGADLRLEGLMNPKSNAQAREAWFILGQLAQGIGLRWGGGSSIDLESGLPVDFNHFDLGPRQ